MANKLLIQIDEMNNRSTLISQFSLAGVLHWMTLAGTFCR
jgi:hypothetical protein